MHGRLNSEPEILVYFAYELWFSRYKVPENQNCTELPQTELEHIKVKSTLHTLNTYHQRPKFWFVSLYD